MSEIDLSVFERGCCSRKATAESGCQLCMKRWAVIDAVRAELARLRAVVEAADAMRKAVTNARALVRVNAARVYDAARKKLDRDR